MSAFILYLNISCPVTVLTNKSNMLTHFSPLKRNISRRTQKLRVFNFAKNKINFISHIQNFTMFWSNSPNFINRFRVIYFSVWWNEFLKAKMGSVYGKTQKTYFWNNSLNFFGSTNIYAKAHGDASWWRPYIWTSD